MPQNVTTGHETLYVQHRFSRVLGTVPLKGRNRSTSTCPTDLLNQRHQNYMTVAESTIYCVHVVSRPRCTFVFTVVKEDPTTQRMAVSRFRHQSIVGTNVVPRIACVSIDPSNSLFETKNCSTPHECHV